MKQQEKEDAIDAQERKAKREKLMGLIANKQDEENASKSIEELIAELGELG